MRPEESHWNSTTIFVFRRRTALLIAAVMLLADTGVAGTAFASSSGSAQPCPPPADPPPENPGPLDCTAIQLLNPSSIAANTRISDKATGGEEGFHVTAVVSHAPKDAVVKAFITPSGGPAELIGELTPAEDSTDTWELYWDIPDGKPEGATNISVQLSERTATGTHEIVSDTAAVTLQHRDPPAAPPLPDPTSADVPMVETADMSWPRQAGPLGFYRPSEGAWATAVVGTLSAGANSTPNVKVYYTKSPIGVEPVWSQECGSATGAAPGAGGPRSFSAACALGEGDLPSQVTAIGVVPQRQETNPMTQQASPAVQAPDVHRVVPFVQDVSEMSVSLRGIQTDSISPEWPGPVSRTAGNACMEVAAMVTDRYGQPVEGANVDVELSGPAGSVGFGNASTSTFKVPEGVAEQDGSDCAGGVGAKHGVVSSGGSDLKRIESDKGSGPPSGGGAEPGEFRFKVNSPVDDWGFTSVRVWVDEVPGIGGPAEPHPDNDVLDAGEPVAGLALQWLEKEVKVIASRSTDVAPLDSCNMYEVRIKGGRSVLANMNVDLHVRGPAASVRFCRAKRLHQPDVGDHGTEEEPGGDSHPPETAGLCPGEGPPCVHREGQTNADGWLRFGLTSNVPGKSDLTVWLDGTEDSNDDLNDVASLAGAFTTHWVGSAGDVKLSFVNPSSSIVPQVSAPALRIVAAVDAPFLIEGVEIELVDPDGMAVSLGKAEHVNQSGTYELLWDLDHSPLPGATPPTDGEEAPPPEEEPEETPPPGEPEETPPPEGEEAEAGSPVPDGSFKLRASIIGTATTKELDLVVNRSQADPTESAPQEWLEITSPRDGRAASFQDGAVKVTGIASSGTEGVDLFYTKAFAGTDVSSWTPCGYADAGGAGTESQPFEGTCTVSATDNPADVTSVAARPFDCIVAGCDATPGAPHRSAMGALESGDAVRILACVDSPCVVVGPSGWRADTSSCQKVVVDVADFNGQPMVDRAIDALLEGPRSAPRTCKVAGRKGLGQLRPGSGGGGSLHVEGSTNAEGLLIFGVRSDVSSFTSIYSPIETGETRIVAWLDEDADDLKDSAEISGATSLHWDIEGRCTVIGTSAADELYATSFPDKICGMGGDDIIFGLDGLTGNDIILGGRGDDTINGQKGDDLIFGDQGNDVIYGGDGNDRLIGGAGNDEIFGQKGDDKLEGGSGTNGCTGGSGKSKKKEKDVERDCQRSARAP